LGQQPFIKNVPSPEIAGLGEFGTVPVSLYTGVPDISIPLHEMRAGNYTLPLSASYHLASVKPNSQPGCLGLGWNLMAGGYITRSVRGVMDETKYADGVAPGYYERAGSLEGMTNEQFVEATLFLDESHGSFYELVADEFSFAFCGYSGNFYQTGENEWTVVSDQDIRVEFDPTPGQGFISLSDLDGRIPTGEWSPLHRNDRYYNKFTLVTPDGCRYEFGGLYATEFSVPYYDRNNSVLTPTTWRLSRITTVEGRTIEFGYDTSAVMCDLRYAPQQKVVTGVECSVNRVQYGRSGMTGYLLFPVYLKTVKSLTETLRFVYRDEAGYPESFVDSYLAWKDPGLYGRDNLVNVSAAPSGQFHVFLGPEINMAGSENDLRRSIKARLKCKILHCVYIEINGGISTRTIYFGYVRNNRVKLSLITGRQGNPSFITSQGRTPHGESFLAASYDIPEDPEPGRAPEYRFTYDTEVTYPKDDYVRPLADSWGYYMGTQVVFSDTPTFQPHTAGLWTAKAETLKEIVYPTGGKTRLEYERHDYSQALDSTRQSLVPLQGSTGGLRVKSVTSLSEGDSVLGIKRYHYSGSPDAHAPSSGVLKSLPVHTVVYDYTRRILFTTLSQKLVLRSQGGFFPSVTNMNTPDVGYSCVIEETTDAEGESLGYIIRRYSNYGVDIHGDSHYDEPPIHSTFRSQGYMVPHGSRSMERGKLLSEEYHDASGRLRKENRYRYKAVNPGSLKTASQEALRFCSDPDNQVVHKSGTLTHTYTYSYLQDSIVESVYPLSGTVPFTRKTALDYDTRKLPSRSVTWRSDGGRVTESYTRAADQPGNGWMRDKHLVSWLHDRTTEAGGVRKRETYWYGSRPVPHVERMDEERNGHSREVYAVDKADPYGNPVSVRERGVPITLLWGKQGQRLMAKIENATLEEVARVSGSDAAWLSSSMAFDHSLIEGIRHKMPQSLFHIYKYTPDLWLESETSPNGTTVHHAYDYLGRLVESYRMERGEDGLLRKRTLDRYDYQYHNHDGRAPGAIEDGRVKSGEEGL
jgi:hypothetical protein